jgi:hypothetical protein
MVGKYSSTITLVKNCLLFSESRMGRSVFVEIAGLVRSKYSIGIQVTHAEQLAVSPTL